MTTRRTGRSRDSSTTDGRCGCPGPIPVLLPVGGRGCVHDGRQGAHFSHKRMDRCARRLHARVRDMVCPSRSSSAPSPMARRSRTLLGWSRRTLPQTRGMPKYTVTSETPLEATTAALHGRGSTELGQATSLCHGLVESFGRRRRMRSTSKRGAPSISR